MNTTFIYVLIDPDTNFVRYVGKSNNPKRRYYKHCSKSKKKTHKVNWINKLLNENKKPILEVIDEVLVEDWSFWESYWICQFKTWGFKLINNTNGGDGCTFANKTSFKKGNVSWNKGKSMSEEAKEHLRQCNLGKKHSNKTKEKMSETRGGKLPGNIEIFLENGKKSRFKKGDESWNKGKKGYKIGGKKSSKIVQQINSNEKVINEFVGCKEAADFMGVTYAAISKCCRDVNKTSCGFKWKYKYE
jgi:group I intron endonuclease